MFSVQLLIVFASLYLFFFWYFILKYLGVKILVRLQKPVHSKASLLFKSESVTNVFSFKLYIIGKWENLHSIRLVRAVGRLM